jgi:fibronectin-binding autotransporter adhesin
MPPEARYSSKFLIKNSSRTRALFVSISAILTVPVSAQLQWDPLGGAPGAQGGAGNWLTSNSGSPWWNGTSNVGWNDGNDAIFSAGTGNVTANAITVDDLTFTSPSSYGLSGSLTLGMGEGSHEISNTGQVTIGASIGGTAGFVKSGSGELFLSGANTFTGHVAVNQGTVLLLNSNALGTGNRVSVLAGASLVVRSTTKTIGSLSGNGAVLLDGFPSGPGTDMGVGNDNTSTTFSGNITGNGLVRFFKVGTGTLTLTGNNNYATDTIIEGGVLEVGGGNAIPDTSGVMVSSPGTLRLLQNEAIHRLRGDGAVELGANTLTLRFGSSESFSGVISGTGGIVAIEGVHTLSGNNSFSGGLTIEQGGAVDALDFGSVGVNGPLGPGPVTLDGGGLGYSGTGTMITNRTVSITSKGATFSGNDGKLVVNSLLTGSGGITARFGTVELTNPGNSFTGGITIKDGTLAISDVPDNAPTSTIGAAGPITIGPGGRLLFTGTGNDSSDRTLVYTSSGFGAATVEVPSGATLTLNSATGAGNLLKTGSGALIQTNPANDFGGNVEIRDGTLETGPLTNSGSPSALGSGNKITLGGTNSTGHLRLPNGVNSSSNRNFDLPTAGGGGRISISNSTVTLNGAFTGNAPVTFAGTNANTDTFVLNATYPGVGAERRMGTTIIDRVKLQMGIGGLPGNVELVNDTGARLEILFPNGIGSLTGGGGPNFGRVTLGADLRISSDSAAVFAGVIDGTGNLFVIGSGNSTLTGGSTFTGSVSISGRLSVPTIENVGVPSPLGSGSVLQFGRNSFPAGTLVFTGVGSNSTNRTMFLDETGGRIDVSNQNGTLVWSGPIGGDLADPAAIALIKEGAGTLRLTGANDYLGVTRIDAGKLQVFGSSALPDTGKVVVSSGATLELVSGTNETIGSIEGGGSLLLGGQRLITGVNGLSSTFSGLASGTTGSSLEKRGAGIFSLTNLNSAFTGGLIVTQGTVVTPLLATAGTNSPIGSNGPIRLGDATNTGRLVVTNFGGNATNRPVQISQGGGIIENRNSDSEVILSGTIAGTGSLVKLGPGRLTLSGDKSFGGLLIVADGTLRLDGSIPGTPVTVVGTGVLDSSSSTPQTFGALTLSGGVVSPGLPGDIGAFNTSGILLESGRMEVDLKSAAPTGYDSLNATGSVSFDGAIQLSINLGYDPQDFVDTFRIIVNDGADPTELIGANTRFFYNGLRLDEGTQFMVESNSFSQLFEVRYGLSPGENDVRFVAAPEPGAASLVALGGMVLGLGRKRKRFRQQLR